jgi:hypothetical protein
VSTFHRRCATSVILPTITSPISPTYLEERDSVAHEGKEQATRKEGQAMRNQGLREAAERSPIISAPTLCGRGERSRLC